MRIRKSMPLYMSHKNGVVNVEKYVAGKSANRDVIAKVENNIVRNLELVPSALLEDEGRAT